METIEEKKLILQCERDFGEVISDSFTFIKQEFAPFMKAQLIISGPFIILMYLFYGVYQKSIFSTIFDDPYQLDPLVFFKGFFMPEFYLFLLFALISTVLFFATTHSYIALYARKGSGNFNIQEQLNTISKNIFPLIVFAIVSFVIIAFGFVFIILPGIFFMVVLSLGFPVFINENKSVFDTISRCFVLIKDRWWQTFGMIIVSSIIVGVFQQMLSLFLMGLMGISMFNLDNFNQMQETFDIYIWVGVVVGIISMFISVISIVVIALQYFSLVEQKDAPALEERMNQINNRTQEIN